MKTLKYLLPVLFIFILFISCNSDDEEVKKVDETENLTLVKQFTNDTHIIEVYTESGMFKTGYNDISLRIKNKADNSYINDLTISWMPMMAMTTMNHSCPKSNIKKVEGTEFMYNGYLVFQMTGVDNSGWSIKFMYNINGTDYMVEEGISVFNNTRQRVATFMGSDGVKYILAMVNPNKPEIAINQMSVTLHKMESMMMFPVVENFTITLDPRMPSMNNHSSTNNTDLAYNATTKMYDGNLSLTMTGYWRLNLKLLNENNDILKGEDLSDSISESTLYLEIEF